MDDAEASKSFLDDLMAKARSTLDADDVDTSSIGALVAADIRNSLKDIGKELNVAIEWLTEIGGWMVSMYMEEKIPGISIEVKGERDDRLIEVACHAVHRSFEQVMEQLHQPRAHIYFSAEKTIQSICKRVLTHFDLLCKNLLIADSWDAINLRNNILKAADIAKDYIRLRKDQIRFPEDGIDGMEKFILYLLRGHLTGNFSVEDMASDMQYATRALDDDHLVGLDGDINTIKERLTGSSSNLEIIPIVGMGGIGKTTLTRKIYEDPQIMFHFRIRAWITVSQEYREKDVLLGLLQQIAPLPEKVYREDKEQLAKWLYQRLKGWRYFIVIDDIWTTEAWDHIKLCFPDDNNKSRIVLTSRVRKLASYVNPQSPPYFMNFLGPEDSWELLRNQVYGKEACPPQLVNVGMQIARKCQGLPLAIKVVAGNLSSISRTQECWEDAAERVGLLTEVSQIEPLFNILAMSYNDLPHYLKACFLSMVIFPKNTEIHVKRLSALWAAMGILPPKLPNIVEEVAMEEVAMNCLEDLIGRSLIMVKKKKFDGKVKLCGIHDLLWDLSVRKARNEGHCIFGNIPDFNACDDMRYVMSLCHTLLYLDHSFETDCPLSSWGFKLLRVLDVLSQSFDHFPREITDLVNLRYLALATSANIPDLVSKLCNLETLLNYHDRAGPELPKEIWLLARIRHLHVGTCVYLPEPPAATFEGSYVSVLPALETLYTLSTASCTKEVFLQIPNLKELGIYETGEEYIEDELLFSSLSNLSYLDQLEILKLCCNSIIKRPRRIPQWDIIVPNIKQLTLIGTQLPWSEMNALAMLCNLEVLKLKENAFEGKEWEMEDKEFLQLKYLLLESLDLMFWKACEVHFPNLQCLVIKYCPVLSGIPAVIGEISTLQSINLEYCNTMTIATARVIQRAQMDMGNEQLIVHIGHRIPLMQLVGLVPAFAFMSLRSEMLWAKTGRRKEMGKDTVSARSEYHRRHSVAGSSAIDDESLASSPTVPGYMTPTISSKAKSRLVSPWGLEKNGKPERRAVGSIKKRLSVSGSQAATRRLPGPPKIDTTSLKRH